jgi:hypothetical protein
MKSILNFVFVGLLAGAILGAPQVVQAQSTNKAPAKSAGEETKKKAVGHPFHGKLAALDKLSKTISVGKSTYQITSETKIKKAGKPATLADGVVGEEVSGYVKPTEDGKLVATTVNFGKADTKNPEKKSSSTEKTQQQ